jgi:hypothetical protein
MEDLHKLLLCLRGCLTNSSSLLQAIAETAALLQDADPASRQQAASTLPLLAPHNSSLTMQRSVLACSPAALLHLLYVSCRPLQRRRLSCKMLSQLCVRRRLHRQFVLTACQSCCL